MKNDHKDYENYVASLKEKLMNFDFSDCPPVQQLAESIADFWLGQEEQQINEIAHDAIGLLRQWKSHANKVMEAEEQ